MLFDEDTVQTFIETTVHPANVSGGQLREKEEMSCTTDVIGPQILLAIWGALRGRASCSYTRNPRQAQSR